MSSPEIVPGRMPQERRQTIMRQYVHGATFQGWRVETADDCQAVLVGEVPVNHVRHVRPGGTHLGLLSARVACSAGTPTSTSTAM